MPERGHLSFGLLATLRSEKMTLKEGVSGFDVMVYTMG